MSFRIRPLPRSALPVGLVAALSVFACGESHTTGEDAAIRFDAAFADAGVDSGEATMGNVGAACGSAADCEDPADSCVAELPDGYCTLFCNTGATCPAGSECVVIDRRGTALCFQTCEPSTEERPCRAGYGCAAELGPPICLPGCFDDSDCADGRTCDPSGGSSGEGACFDSEASLGDACARDSDCQSGGFCFAERFSQWPGGACTAFGCDVASGDGCPDDGVCIPTGGGGGGLCILACDEPEECREGYTCTAGERFPERRYCGPAFVASNLGQICSAGRGSCVGGVCLSEVETGYPDSYCVALCDPEADESGCPDNGVCAPNGACLLACDGGGCRDGYACRPSDPADPESATACVPGCTSAEVCGNDDFICNEGTGRCTPELTATIGAECIGVDDCPGGRCLTEPDRGWPGGACVLPGCRLEGEGPSTDCPTGSACIDDGEGDPELGVCASACDGDTPCRSGYRCEPEDAEAPEGPGACVPGCEADDCSAPRTCDATTGRCVEGG